MIRQLDDRTLVSGQIAPHEVAGLAGQGVTMLVNNRPGRRRAEPAARRGYRGGRRGGRDRLSLRPDHPRHRPGRCRGDAGGVARGRQGGKLLAFCRSGTRSAFACALAHREEGASSEECRRTADRGRVRSRPDRAFALGLELAEAAAGVSSTILVEHHQPDSDQRAVGIEAALRVENDGLKIP